MSRFRVVTYNIHRSRGIDWRVRPARILQVLEEIEADVIALQEVIADHLPFLYEHSAFHHVFGPSEQLKGAEYGNVVFSRYPIVRSDNHDLSVRWREHRRCLQADIQLTPERMLHVFAVHLGTSFLERRQQAAKMTGRDVLRNPALTGPRLVLGDFNEWTKGLVTRMLSEQLESANVRTHLRQRKTYPGVFPFLHLDHIYYDSSLRMTSMHLHKTQASLAASDHLPLVGDFEMDSLESTRR